MKLTIFLLIGVFSIVVSAHEGHGAENFFLHNIEHSIWYISGFLILFGLVFMVTRKR